jgi:hypothetical protein
MIPKNGKRFSDKIMLKIKNGDRDPMQSDRIAARAQSLQSETIAL